MERSVAMATLLSALLGGAAGGLVVHWAHRPAPGAKPTASAGGMVASPDGDPREDLARRVARLEAQAGASQRERVLALAERLRPAPDAGAPVDSRGGAVVDDPVFDVAVRDILDQVNAERREERRRQFVLRGTERAAEWTNDVETALGLTAVQKGKVAEILGQHFEALVRARTGDDGEEPSREARRERMREAREKTEAKLAAVLDAGQVEKFEAMKRDGDVPGFWGERRGGRRAGRADGAGSFE